jgi:hypothetical protein
VAPRFVALAQYNLACVRVRQQRLDDAMQLLEDALPASDVLRANAPKDPDLAPLYDNPRFKELAEG